MSVNQTILNKAEVLDGKYAIQFFIKKGSHAETYRAKDNAGNTRFLKVFQLSKLHKTQFDTEGNIKEIEFLKQFNHKHVVQFIDSGEFIKENDRYSYLVLDFISGETVEERLRREHTLSAYEVKKIITGVLHGLHYLHNLNQPIIHNDINHQNIMLDLSGTDILPRIIDFGYARYFHNSTKVYYRVSLNPYYLAPECFNNIFSAQSDIFSVGALIFHLLTGFPPWFVDLSEYKKQRIDTEDAVLEARQRPLKLPYLHNKSDQDPDYEHLIAVAFKALEADCDKRFKSANEMLDAIRDRDFTFEKSHQPTSKSFMKANKAPNPVTGNGFNDIAGMDELKECIYHDVIRALEEKELYEEYGLTIPNGMLLYGPPGCGKSFFAQKLAEEVGYNFVEIKPSSLASIYVHGSQEKIGQLFEEAKKNAPTILNFEEFDALVPRRDNQPGHYISGEVNELLAQLNNCGKDGVFVIASTNQPALIDPAVLRAGRIDKIFYVPPPDFKARKEMFRMLLEKRPIDLGIDFDLLADKTENYVSSDINLLVNESARRALREKTKITQQHLIDTISSTTPSVKISEIRKYEQIRHQFESEESGQSRPPIGFRPNN